MKAFATMPGRVSFTAHVPALAAFHAEPDLNAPNAAIEATGELANGADGYAGKVDVAASGITLRDFVARRLVLNISIARSVATIDALNFALNDTDGATGSGRVELRPPFVYDASLQANVRDLSKFNALIPNLEGGLGGSLSLDWDGRGNVSELQHAGNLRLALADGKAAGVTRIHAQIAGSYSPELIDLPVFWVTTSKGDVSALIGLKDRQLTIADLLVKEAGKPLLTGYVLAPLDLRTPKQPETILPLDGPVTAEIKTAEIDLAALPTFGAPKKTPVKKGRNTSDEPPVRGKVSAIFPRRGPWAISMRACN